MTLTITLPDETAAAAAAAGLPSSLLPVLAALGAQASILTAANAMLATSERKRSVMEFEGVGKGQPGAVGGDVNAYIRSLRDDDDDDAEAAPE